MDGYDKKMRRWEVTYAKTGDPVKVGQVQATGFEGALKQARTFQPHGFKIASLICTGLIRETAEDRTRIGNTPTCDECGEQHSQDLTCEESAEMTACDPKQ